jgi:peptidoglycan-associated lipoprotein
MRATLTATILISALLAGCASTNDGPANKNISQTGALKVHPGLLGQPVPAELQQDMRPAVVQPAPAPVPMPARHR